MPAGIQVCRVELKKKGSGIVSHLPFFPVLGTPEREPVCLVVVAVHVRVVVVHVPVPGVGSIVLGGTQPVAVVANVVEGGSVEVAAGQGAKQAIT